MLCTERERKMYQLFIIFVRKRKRKNKEQTKTIEQKNKVEQKLFMYVCV